jgi:hypothetical protein
MNVKIFRLFIALMISVVSPILAPQGGKTLAAGPDRSHQGDSGTTPFFQGVYLSADVFGYIYPIFVKDKYYSSELSLTANLKNRFFPIVEVGVGHTDMVSHLYSIGYRTHAPYYRVGMDYNMQYEKGKSSYIYIGGRVGYTSFDYSVDAPPLVDPIWGEEASAKFADVSCRAVWVEAVGGVRAEIAKNFYMGWSLRYKYPLYIGPITNGGPWYIPGYGTGKNSAFGATYSISYYFKL